jgi:peroxiredoxin
MKTVSVIVLALLFNVLGIQAQSGPKGLELQAVAPSFSANDQNGKPQELKSLLSKGAVVLVFYRGQWCPYCNKQLKQLQDSLSQITSKGAMLVAVTPEKPENITKTLGKTKASYPVLYDAGLKIMKSYDVAFGVDAATIEKYKKYGIDFEQANGANGANLPVPAVYIINKEGKITYKHFDADYTKRPSVAEIVSHL